MNRISRVLVGAALLAGMVLLWTGSVIHYGPANGTEPAALIAEVQAHHGALVARAATDIASMACFLLGAIGLVAIVRGRGRRFAVATAVVMALGVPSHVLGASYLLFLTRVASADIATADQAEVVGEFAALQNLYFVGLVPFLLGLVLIPVTLWRARAVSWIPLALLVLDLVVIGRFTGSTTPSVPLWWIDPVVAIVVFGWLAIGVARYRPAETTPVPSPAPVIKAELVDA